MRLVERLAGGDICVAHRAVTDAGREVFVKSLASAPAGFFAAEAAGLAWLADAGGVPVPEVIEVDDHQLVLASTLRVAADRAALDPGAVSLVERVALHQLHPLLVHAALFGGSYAAAVRRAAETALRSAG